MRERTANRLGVAHVRDTVKQFVAGSVTREQAMKPLQIGLPHLYRRACVRWYLDLFYRAFSRYGLPLDLHKFSGFEIHATSGILSLESGAVF